MVNVMRDSRAEVSSRYRLEAIMFRLAREHADKAEEWAKKYSKSHERSDLEREMEHSLQAIILSHAFLEAYINLIERKRLGKNSSISQTTKLGFMGKWSRVVEAVTGKSLKNDCSLWKRLGELNDLRSKIIHYRPKFSEGVKSWEEKEIRSENARVAVLVAELVVRKFHELDGSDPPDFLETLKAGKDYRVVLGEKI